MNELSLYIGRGVLVKLCFYFVVSRVYIQVRSSASFSREVLVDFMAAQIKTLSFLAYIIKIYQDQVCHHSASLVRGVLGLLMLCPPEVAHLRKEILIAAKHILQTDLRLS